MSTTDSTADRTTPEAKARDTIDNLLTGKIASQTVVDLKKAVDRTSRDYSIGRSVGR